MEVLETKSDTGLQLLDKHEAELIILRNESKGLKIVGPDDKAGYKIVREQRLKLKNARTTISNHAKDLREGAIKFQKTVIAREKELIAIIASSENDLIQEEEAYNEAVEKIRIEKDRKENERIQDRVNQLAKFNHGIDLYDAKIMPEEDFQALLGEAEAAFNIDQERIAKEKAEAEAQRIAEQERLRVEREELDRQRVEFEKREADLKAIREKELAEQKAEQDRIKADQEQRENVLRAEREKLDAEKREMQIEQVKKEAAEKAVRDAEEKTKHEAEEKIERERLAKIEAERREALKPDKEKLFNHFSKIRSAITDVNDPELADRASIELFGAAKDKLILITNEISHRINLL